MKHISYFLFLLILSFTNCQLNKNNIQNEKKLIDKINFDKIAIINSINAKDIIGKRVNFQLTENDFSQIESIILKEVYKHNKEFGTNIKLKDYYRQYVAFINNEGEKVVWINLFCNYFNTDWKKNVVFVLDGGECYFNLKINIEKGFAYDFEVNGYA